VMKVMLLLPNVALAALLASSSTAPAIRSGRRHHAAVACDSASRIDVTIGEILEERDDTLPALLGRRLDVLTNQNFLPRVEERRADAPDGRREELARVGEVVVSFLEELTARVSELEPELLAEQQAADAMAAKAAAAATAAIDAAEAPAQAVPEETTEPCAKPCCAGETADAPAQAAVAQVVPEEDIAEAVPQPAHDEADAPGRERRAKYRYLVERLLDAAKVGTERLDTLLREERSMLDGGFFEHMRWEVEQQTDAKNRKLLHILEVVVQRACVEVEEGRSEVALLSAVLQTRNPTARAEMYARELAPASPRVQASFAQLVLDTQLELEKAVLRGERVDADLLQMLRIVSAEAGEYIALP